MKSKRRSVFFLILCLLLMSCRPSGPKDVTKDSKASSLSPEKVPFSLTVFDAGKGDAFLLSSPDYNLLIDCGHKGNADQILTDLSRRNINKLDLMIISHFDKDHVGGASKIIKKFPVERVITTRRTNDDKRTLKFFEALEKTGLVNEVPSADIDIDGGCFHITVSPPERPYYSDSEDNNSSLLVKVTGGYGTLLLTGDAEKDRVEEILERDDLKCDLLKIPHHGTESWKLEELLSKTDPRIAVITSSVEEPADPEVTECIESKSIICYNTAETGTFTLIFDEDGIRKE